VERLFNQAVFEEDPDQKLEWLRQGIALEPGCMAFHLQAARLHVERGERPQGATALAAALKCYHHTSYENDLAADYELGRELSREFPNEFTDFDRRDLATTNDKPRLLWVTELYQQGEVEPATKLLADMCHEMEDYDSVLHLFRKHFEKLGWAWAEALCDFRSGSVA
jgi:hypothetical protein